MAVNTKKAAGRRKVHYDSYEDLLADAQRLADGPTKMIGNWSLGQIFKHLAVAFNGAIDGLPFKAPWYLKIIAKLLMKKKFLYGEMPAGFQIPDKHRDHFIADESTTTEEGLALLKEAVHRLQTESHREPHPVFDHLSNQEWDAWNLRHAELHLSFAIPAEQPADVRAEAS